MKVASSSFIKDQGLFPSFDGWQNGYAAFTYSFNEKDRLIDYVINQEDHHKRTTYIEELTVLLTEHGVNYDSHFLLQ